MLIYFLSPNAIFRIGFGDLGNTNGIIQDKLVNIFDIAFLFYVLVFFVSGRKMVLPENKNPIFPFLLLTIFASIVVSNMQMWNSNYSFIEYLDSMNKFFRFFISYFFINALLLPNLKSIKNVYFITKSGFISIILLSPLAIIVRHNLRAGAIGFGINMLAIISVALLIWTLVKRNRKTDGLIIIIAWMGIFLSSSKRGLLLGIFISLVVVCKILFLSIKSTKIKIIHCAGLLLVPTILIMTAFFPWDISSCTGNLLLLQRMNKGLVSLIDTRRVAIWTDAFSLILEKPLLGYGGSDLYLQDNIVMYYHAHNVFFQNMLLYGFIVGICFFLTIMLLTWVSFRFRKCTIKDSYQLATFQLGQLWSCFFVSWMLFSLTGYGFYYSKGWYLFCFATIILIKSQSFLKKHSAYYIKTLKA